MTLTTKDLTTKAMLVSLNITKWTAKKYDKKATSAVQHEFKAEEKSGRYRKSLADKEFLAEVNSIISSARNFHDENTRPWIDEGPRILPSKNYMYHAQQLREFHDRFNEAVGKVAAQLDTIKENARQFLGDLYDENDYPGNAAELLAKYSFRVSVSPIPNANDFRVTQISDEDIAEIQKQITERLEEENKLLMKDLWERLHEVVQKAFDTFSDPNARFHDSKIDNITEMVGVLRRLNMDDDPKLERMCKVVEEKICSLDPNEIRKQPDARKDAAQDVKSILDTIGSYF